MSGYFAPQDGRVAIVIAHFNPCFYAQREYNLRQCLRTYRQLGIPVFIGACIPPGQQWDLDAPEYQDRVRVFRNRDFLWNRERLINLTVEALVSPEYSFVGWSDADIIEADQGLTEFSFGTRDYPDQRCFIQPFAATTRLDRLGQPLRTTEAIATTGELTSARLYAADTGTAWLAPRDFWSKCGLYRYALTGAGDQLLAAVLIDQMDEQLFRAHIGDEYAPHWRDYSSALKAYRGSLAGKQLTCLGGKAVKGWAGNTHQGRVARASAIQTIKLSHLRIEDGLLRWAPEAPDSIREMTKQAFYSRKEDTP